ncbi:DUF948 domain-containing protein [Lactobacillus sp. M0390]|uniref:DUF948 domain-containing protein n=1 Tax=Lactobacillus sp. M0390 TaxID=2751026 RepID=UPI0018DAFEA5|nr:DUF948 domain-containing protein [Lactobacillus sp. M0390]MBH9986470.1 DUF948 domain-containing protein [Lactobacillus sp. M0390]
MENISYGEVAGLIAAAALLVLILFTIPVLIHAAKAAKQANQTIKAANESLEQISKDIDVLAHQTSDLLDKTNVLLADVNVKMETLDPVVKAAADLGESVSDVNASSRKMAKRVSNFHLNSGNGFVSSALSSMFARRKRRKGKE